MVGMGRVGPLGVSEEDLRRRFARWELTRAARIPGEAFWPRFRPSRPLRLLARLPAGVWRFEMRRLDPPP